MSLSRDQLVKTYLHIQSLNVIGRMRHDALVSRFGSIENSLQANLDELIAIEGINLKIAHKLLSPMNHEQLDKEIDIWKNNQVKIFLIIDDDYPEHLKQNDDAPIVLQIKGDYLEEDKCAIAIVGSRNCSPYGKQQAFSLAKELGQYGFTIVSGMARGIDSAAHRGALEAGARTIAVQACGLSKVYPSSGQQLSKDILMQGALVSELSWWIPPMKQNFPRRNRIISGMSIATLVIEAAEKSGSLITARWAMQQNRDVFALPGQVDNPLAMGCLKLIQDGAKCITCVEDILEEFPTLKQGSNNKQRKIAKPHLNEQQLSLFSQFENDSEVKSFNDLLNTSTLNSGELSLALMQLEGKQLLKALPQKCYQANNTKLFNTNASS